MANRRQLDSSQHNNHHVAILRNTYFQFKTLLLTLAFISLLISIHCASFGHRSVDQQQQQPRHKQWHNQPDYQVLSETKDDINLDDVLNYRPYAVGSRQQPDAAALGFKIDELEQSLKDSYLASPSSTTLSKDHPSSASTFSSSPYSPPDEDVDQLYNQLLMARRLFKDQSSSSSPSSSSSLLTLDDYLPNLAADSSGISNNNNNNGDDNDDDDLSNAKLIEQLLRDERQRLSSSALSQLGSLQNYDLKYDNPKNPLYFLPDHHQYNELVGDQNDDKITLTSQDGDESSISSTSNMGDDHQGAKVTYRLSVEDSDEMNKNEQEESSKVGRNMTTLLEDEAVLINTTSTSGTGGQSNTSTAKPPATGEMTTPTISQVSYGSIVAEDSRASQELHDKSSMSAMFNRLYDKLASYVSNFKIFSIDPKSKEASAPSKVEADNKKSLENTTEGPVTSILKSSTSSRDNGSGRDNSSSVSHNDLDKPNKLQVAATKTDDDGGAGAGKDKSTNKLASNDDNLDSAKMGTWTILGSNENDNTETIGADNSNEGADNKRLVDESRESNRPNKGHKVSLLRQSSSLVLPIKSNDELIIQSESVTHPASLLGKYIYAPEHHYHLSTLTAAAPPSSSSNAKRVDIDDEQQMYTQMSQRSYMRRLHPGDSVYSSYSGSYNPMYDDSLGPHGAPMGHQGGLSGIGNNKTNDVYFLAMVGSFCAMAMAVVLAAGLFAYRVQQQRKASSETDYPTYGVVGPNSMNGKCGAASFVGGYFGSGHHGAGGPGSSSTCGSSKTDSVKHLADLYCSDSGLASGGNGNNKANKKATSEQNNPAGNNSNNFMANQNAARMYHYQHQKQQMIISDRNSAGRHASASDLDSEDENDDGTYTVYECPGLASAHEMEIKNPLFNDDQSP